MWIASPSLPCLVVSVTLFVITLSLRGTIIGLMSIIVVVVCSLFIRSEQPKVCCVKSVYCTPLMSPHAHRHLGFVSRADVVDNEMH